MLEKVKRWAKMQKRELAAIYFAYKDERTPWYTKMFIGILLLYAFSPIDLIPDFVPVLGYLDDLILLPIGIYCALKLIPDIVIADAREKAEHYFENEKPKRWFGAVIIVIIWLIVIFFLIHLL